MSTVQKVFPGSVAWLAVTRYELEGVILDRPGTVQVTKLDNPPVMDVDGLVMLRQGGDVLPWREAKDRISESKSNVSTQ